MTDFTIQVGIPFGRVIRVAGGKDVWPDLDDFEVRSQLRKNASPTSTLLANLHDYMTADFDGADILITWTMTGAQVRGIDANGCYDVVISDVGETDARAIRVLEGKIRFTNTVTSAAGDEA